MPGMNGASALAFSILANSLYFQLFILGAIGAIVATVAIYILPSLNISPGLTLSRKRIAPEGSEQLAEHVSFINTSFALLWIFDGILQMRPDMPGGFVQNVAAPSLSGAPSPVIILAKPFLDLWNAHPVHADVATAWIQVSIGVALLVVKSVSIRRIVLWSTIVWSLAVLVVGNGFGIFYPGASWVTGAPSAIYAYLFAAAYLLLATSKGHGDLQQKAIPWFVGTFLTIGGILQALPSSGYWTSDGLASMAHAMSLAGQPSYLSEVLRQFSRFAAAFPIVANTLMVLLPIAAAVLVVFFPERKWALYFVIAAELVGWSIGMDFGIFSPTGTDPNSGLPIILLTISMLRAGSEHKTRHDNMTPNPAAPSREPSRPARFILLLCLTSALASVLVTGMSLLGPASPSMAEVDSGGIQKVHVTGFNMPALAISGSTAVASVLRHHSVALVFVGNNCISNCKQVIREVQSASRSVPNSNVVLVTSSAIAATTLSRTILSQKSRGEAATLVGWLSSNEATQLRDAFSLSLRRAGPPDRARYIPVFFKAPSASPSLAVSASGNRTLAASYHSLFENAIRSEG